MRIRVLVAFLGLTLIWGASFLWIKIAVRELPPVTLVAFRLTLAAVTLAIFALVRRTKPPRDPGTWLSLVALSILTTAAPWVLISWAEQTIDSALATVLNGTVPLFTMVLAHFFLRDDPITPGRVTGLAVAFVGLIVLAQRGAGREIAWRGSLLGQGAMLLSSFCYAAGGVLARRRLRHLSALAQAFYSIAFSAVLMWGMIPIVDGAVHIPTRTATWFALAWLGVLAAGIASVMYYFVLHSVGPTRTTLVTYTIPLVGVTLGVVVLHERLDGALALGTIMIVSGVWFVNRAAAKARRPQERQAPTSSPDERS